MDDSVPSADAVRPGPKQVYERVSASLLGRLRTGFSYRLKSGERRSVRVASAFMREEILQETFVRFIDHWQRQTFDRSRPPEPYVMSIAFYVALETLGKAAREIPGDDPEVTWAATVAPIQSAEAMLEVQQRSSRLRAFVESLTDQEQELYRLSFQEELSQAKVAEQLGMSRDQVYRVLVGIRERLAAYFEDRGWLREA